VDIRMPKLRVLPFETAIIERYRRRESSVTSHINLTPKSHNQLILSR